MSLNSDELNRSLSLTDRNYLSHTKDSNGFVAKRVSGETKDVNPFGRFDEIQATYPTGSSESYEYLLNSVSLGTIVVTYTNSSKSVLVSVIYNAV